GRSSRALIRKGKLRYVVEPSAGGQVMRVLDENNQHLPDASVVLGGRRFTADDQGEILIPYSTQPGPQPLILEYQQSATLEQFHHAAESYALSAGIYVDREQLLRDRRAKVIVRAGLKVNGQPETLAVLEEVRL